MHKNTLWLLFAILCIYLTLVFCEQQQQHGQSQETNKKAVKDTLEALRNNDSTAVQEEARTRRHRHHLYHMWGWHALAIAYLVKIKVVVVAFFVGSAIYFGLRYFWPHKCNTEIILDHPPPNFSHHHDHIPYSLGHSDHYMDHPPFDATGYSGSSGPDASSYEPYSAYAGSYGGSGGAGGADVITDTSSTETQTFRKKRDVKPKEKKYDDSEEIEDHDDDDVDDDDDDDEMHEEKEQLEQARQRPMDTEEQIGNFMFSFLGLDSKSCRRRFICEMEFRSKTNPLTAMAFRVIGRSFFGKYTNDLNEMGRANSYEQCAVVNSECVFIENEDDEQEQEEEVKGDELQLQQQELEEKQNPETETETTDDVEDSNSNSLESNDLEERANIHNLLQERKNFHQRRVRGDRLLKL